MFQLPIHADADTDINAQAAYRQASKKNDALQQERNSLLSKQEDTIKERVCQPCTHKISALLIGQSRSPALLRSCAHLVKYWWKTIATQQTNSDERSRAPEPR